MATLRFHAETTPPHTIIVPRRGGRRVALMRKATTVHPVLWMIILIIAIGFACFYGFLLGFIYDPMTANFLKGEADTNLSQTSLKKLKNEKTALLVFSWVGIFLSIIGLGIAGWSLVQYEKSGK